MLSRVHYICSNGGSPKFRLPAPLIIIDEVHYYYSTKPAQPNPSKCSYSHQHKYYALLSISVTR